MKLNLKIYNAVPRTEKVKLDAELVEFLDSYVQYYQEEFKSSISTETIMIEMLHAFIKSDRSFMRWYRVKKSDSPDEKKL